MLYQSQANQNINLIEHSDPHVVAIFGGDHIYRMNVMSMIDYHVQHSAEVTVAAIPVPKKHAAEFGVIEASEDGHILGFHEKNANAPPCPATPRVCTWRWAMHLLHAHAASPVAR